MDKEKGVSKDKKLINLSETYELDYALMRNDCRRTKSNRALLVDKAKKEKKRLGVRCLNHNQIDLCIGNMDLD